MAGRLAMDRDGNLSWCTAPLDKMGQGRCSHILHQMDGESVEEFIKRAENTVNEMQCNHQHSPDYVIDKLDLDDYVLQHVHDENFDDKFLILQTLMDHDLPIRLKGGFSITANVQIVGQHMQGRPTKDVYLDWWGNVDDAVMAETILNTLNDAGYHARLATGPNMINKRIIIDGLKEKTQVDICHVDENGNHALSMNEVLGEKVRLKIAKPDRRFKDLVDTQIILQSKYPDGITKNRLMEIIGDADPNAFLTPDHIADAYQQAGKFKPSSLNGANMYEYADSFINMLEGIANPEIPHDALFKFNYGWVH